MNKDQMGLNRNSSWVDLGSVGFSSTGKDWATERACYKEFGSAENGQGSGYCENDCWYHVLWRTHLLEASLIGFTLFLGFIIDRMHHYLTKLIRLRSNAGSSKEEVEQLQKEKLQLKEKEEKASKEMKRLQKEVSTVSENLNKLKLECAEKDKKIETAEAHVTSLQKQSADLLLEYDRLLEDNQNLQNQAHRS
ncbi:hypothetical protein QYF36_012066 [Acer negundo]|nr:hypothetical protein QYF36_012066 [Acer negundo]